MKYLESLKNLTYVPAYGTAKRLNNDVHVYNSRIGRSRSGLAVCFDIGWEASWRAPAGMEPGNWDAVWIFVKMSSYKMKQGAASTFNYQPGSWGPAYFANDVDDHKAPVGAQIVPAEDGLGVFIQRRDVGQGTVDFKDVQLALADSTAAWIAECQELSFAVFAVRMVYIPEGPFRIGDPNGRRGPMNCFYDPTVTSGDRSYQVTSEEAIEVGPDAQIYYRGSSLGGDQEGPIPAEFPKGYEAFYLMRSHVSQRQYARFTNLISSAAKTERFPYMGQGAYRFTIFTDRDGLRIATRGLRPCNFLAWADGAAYAAWAGLRPMSELEFAKACRGADPAVAGEFAWGNTNIEYAQIIVGNEGWQEVVSGNCNTENAYVDFDGGDGGQGPVRDDAFLRAGSPDLVTSVTPQALQSTELTPKEQLSFMIHVMRQESGASYYNVMGLSGNLWEYCVSVGDARGRAFTGTPGDGRVDSLGNADYKSLGWPGANVRGVGYRGGSWYTTYKECRLADRTYGGGFPSYTFRSHDTGMRCARTAPKTQT